MTTRTNGRAAAVTSTERPGLGGVSSMQPLSWKVVTWSLGLFGAVTFVVCVVYGFLVPKAFHMAQLLEIALPGFKWLSVGSFFLGLVESFLYGAYAGLVFTPLYNYFSRRWAR